MKRTTNARTKPTDKKRLSLAKTTFRTALGNGSRILDGVDGRSLVARRYAEVAAGIATDLGGDEQLTELQQHLIRTRDCAMSALPPIAGRVASPS